MSSQRFGCGGALGPEAGQITAGSCGPRKSLPVLVAYGERSLPNAAAQSWEGKFGDWRCAFVAEQQVLAPNRHRVREVYSVWLGLVSPYG